MGVIKRLPEIVVNRIAAGEVVVRPANAVKELIENSLDAGATEIVVSVKNGGLDMIQIQDNGKGIYKDDLDLACERFTTSKLTNFEDLQSMQTYGFRGEALASISLVSKVTITSKPAEQQVAYQAKYLDGKVTAIRPSAGQNGTVITAEDLFHNCPSRRLTFKNQAEETARVADVVTKYAVFRPDVKFALRKGTTGSDFRTSGDGKRKTVITQLLGSHYAEDLLDIDYKNESLKFKLSGCFSRPTVSATSTAIQARKDRRKQFFIFINGRDVQCPLLKHGFEKVITDLTLVHSFVIVSLEMDPARIDVNVHPTKQNVIFLDEDLIVDDIASHIQELLGDFSNCDLNAGRQIRHELTSTQVTRIPSYSQNIMASKSASEESGPSQSQKKRVDHMNIRTDSKEQKINQFLTSSQESRCSLSDAVLIPVGSVEEDGAVNYTQTGNSCKRTFMFESLSNLRREICVETSQELRDLFKTISFVGCINAEHILVQYSTSLFMFNLRKITEELFYQILLFSFGNFGSVRLDNGGISVEKLFIHHAKKLTPEMIGNAADAALFLAREREMLNDLFSLTIEMRPSEEDENVEIPYLVGIPSIIDGYIPQLEGLPALVYDLISEIDWETEENCFKGVCVVLSKFFTIKEDFCEGTLLSGLGSKATWKAAIEDLFVPRLKTKLIPTNKLKNEGYINRLTDLHDLYKVFERC
ncbi:unnamed protein product [Auanema sp. JU1783]|nr:unnamed protein product [Auanema sp. JU1783]